MPFFSASKNPTRDPSQSGSARVSSSSNSEFGTHFDTTARHSNFSPNHNSYSVPISGWPEDRWVHQVSSPAGVAMAAKTLSAEARMGKSWWMSGISELYMP